jgi:hypothetical protein
MHKQMGFCKKGLSPQWKSPFFSLLKIEVIRIWTDSFVHVERVDFRHFFSG